MVANFGVSMVVGFVCGWLVVGAVGLAGVVFLFVVHVGAGLLILWILVGLLFLGGLGYGVQCLFVVRGFFLLCLRGLVFFVVLGVCVFVWCFLLGGDLCVGGVFFLFLMSGFGVYMLVLFLLHDLSWLVMVGGVFVVGM